MTNIAIDATKGERNAPKSAHATRERLQTLTIALHWITVLLIVTQFTLAILHDQVSDAEARLGAVCSRHIDRLASSSGF